MIHARLEWIVLKKRSISSKKLYFLYIFDSFHCFSPYHSQEWIAPVALRSVTFFKRATGTTAAHYKRATVSDLLPSLNTKERRELFAIFQEWITLLVFSSQNTSNTLKKPKSEFPTLRVRLLWYSTAASPCSLAIISFDCLSCNLWLLFVINTVLIFFSCWNYCKAYKSYCLSYSLYTGGNLYHPAPSANDAVLGGLLG